MLGRTIGGRYRIISRLGVGGMSEVYLARHVLIGRLVAVKCLLPSLIRDPAHRDRFMREARAINRVHHENIVEVTDFGESDDGLIYMVMEYVPGEPLDRVMQKTPFPPLRGLNIARQMASALARAHQMGVIHRDLKPGNALLMRRKGVSDFVKLLDFGIAKVVDAPSITMGEQVFGTPGYIAPEYVRGTKVDARSDLYSLGVILYEMVTGELPYRYEYPGDLLAAAATEPAVPLRERMEDVHPLLEALVLRCIEKEPSERFRDAFHLVEELDAVRVALGDSVGDRYSDQQDGEDERGAASDDSQARLIDPEITRSVRPQRARSVETAPGRGQTLVVDAKDTEPMLRAGAETDSASPETDSASMLFGSAGLRAWYGVTDGYERLDRLRERLRQSGLERSAREKTKRRIRRAESIATEIESLLTDSEEREERVEALLREQKAVQSTWGQRLDEAAGKLSHVRGVAERVNAERRVAFDAREAALTEAHRQGVPDGEADSLLWRLSALEQKLKDAEGEIERLTQTAAELQLKLEHEQLRVERALQREVEASGLQLTRIQGRAADMRAILSELEVQFERGGM